jgi:hypothetical protein
MRFRHRPDSPQRVRQRTKSVVHVGARGFEPPTSWSQTTRSTKLSYAPSSDVILYHGYRLPASANSVTLRRKRTMKVKGLIFSALLGGITLTLRGQDAAPPAVDLYGTEKQPEITATPEPNGPDLPELSQLDEAFKRRSLSKEVDQRRLHIEWRQLKNQVVNDPEVRAAKAAAQATRTDLEKRNRLRDYYDVYYERMSALAASVEIKLALQRLKTSHVARLSQPRVRPSTDGSLPAPRASPGKKHKKKSHKW